MTFHLNELPQARIQQFQSAGILVGGSATCIAEAKRLALARRGFTSSRRGEAGGHRGTWTRDPTSALTGTLALVRMLVRG